MDEIIFFVAFKQYVLDEINFPPASKASREIANLTERKIHKPPNRVSKNLSVWRATVLWTCRSQKIKLRVFKFYNIILKCNFDPNYLRTGNTEWAKKNLGDLWQKALSQKSYISKISHHWWLGLYFSTHFTVCSSSKNGEMGLFNQCF